VSDLLHVAPAELVFHVDEPRISPDGAVIELDYRIAHVSTVGPVERFTETITLPPVESPVEVGDGFRAMARLLALAAGTSF
jgi:hypothetical protein